MPRKKNVIKATFKRPPDRLGKAILQCWIDLMVLEGAKDILNREEQRRKRKP